MQQDRILEAAKDAGRRQASEPESEPGPAWVACAVLTGFVPVAFASSSTTNLMLAAPGRRLAVPMSASKTRLLHIDALKALAAQLIVLHHLSVYGPLAEALHKASPVLGGWLFHYGRMAVQVFLVVGGYLSARALSPQGGLLKAAPLESLWRRYLRLALPFMAAVGLTLSCAWLVQPWMPEFLPQQLSLATLLSHATLTHGLLGHESITVGAWYVAIDLQLYALMLGLLWLARRSRPLPHAWRMVLGPGLVLALCGLSLLVFNRESDLDNWGIYFFGAYGLGALVHWCSLSRWPRMGLLMLLWLAGLALWVDFRERLVLALLTALLLGLWQWRVGPLAHRLWQRVADVVSHLGTHSYSLFLVHFPVLVLLNAWYDQQSEQPLLLTFALALSAWGFANLAALPFHRWVEAPSNRLRFNPLRWLAPQGSLGR